MQTDNRVLDQFARFFTNAAGAAQAFKSEMETMIKARLEKTIADLDFVPREEFDADRKSTRLNSSHSQQSRMPSSA